MTCPGMMDKKAFASVLFSSRCATFTHAAHFLIPDFEKVEGQESQETISLQSTLILSCFQGFHQQSRITE